MPSANELKLDLNYLRSIIFYDQDTGDIWWKFTGKGRNSGMPAGSITKQGYRTICINYCSFGAHRLIWFYIYGKWPIFQIDHKNKIKDDNRFINLREATPEQNCANRTKNKPPASGFVGVTRTSSGRFRAIYERRGKSIAIGTFDTAEAASAAYQAAIAYRGEFIPVTHEAQHVI